MALSRDDSDRSLDALRISPQDHQALVSDLDQKSSSFRGADLRTEARISYKAPEGVVLQLQQPGGPRLRYLVKTRNLSSGGVGVLHGAYIHVGTECTVEIKALDEAIVRIPSTIVRCRHVRGHIHEIGIKFDQLIDLADFLTDRKKAERIAGGQQETQGLSGRILYTENSVDDRRLLQFLMESLGIEMQTASNGPETLGLVEGTLFDMLIVNVWLPEMTGPLIAENLRSKGYPGPIVAVTADDRKATADDAIAKGCNYVLVKPFDFDELVTLIGRYVRLDGNAPKGSDVLISSKWYYVKMRPLILAYLDRLERQVGRIENYMNAQDARAIQRLCLELKGSAGGYGYRQIGDAADELRLGALGDSPHELLRTKFDELAELCKAACRMQRKTGTSA